MALPLVLGLFFNQVSNWHLHKLENGLIVEHAHPFQQEENNSSPFQDHKHSNSEYIFFAQISSGLVILIFTLVALLAVISKIPSLKRGIFSIFVQSPDFSANLLRGPPSGV